MADQTDGTASSGRGRDQKPEPDAAQRRPAAERRKPETPTLTDDLTGKFIRVGNKLYRTSNDRKPIARLEPDRVRTGNLDALPDIVRIAKANGWTSLRVSGGDTFKKAAFLAAAAQGLTVENYTPSKAVEAEAERLRARLAARDKQRDGKEKGKASVNPANEAAASKALAERFLRQTHEENARDPELRRAQTLVAQVIAITRAKYPDEPAKASRDIAAKRQEVALRIAGGDKIAGIQVRNEQAQQSRAVTQDKTLQQGRTR